MTFINFTTYSRGAQPAAVRPHAAVERKIGGLWTRVLI